MDWKDALSGLLPDDYQPEEQSVDAPKPQQSERLDVLLDRKGRGGKVATIVAGFTIPDDDVAHIAATLKKRLGTGGSARGGEILIQGDRTRQVADTLKDMGFKVRTI